MSDEIAAEAAPEAVESAELESNLELEEAPLEAAPESVEAETESELKAEIGDAIDAGASEEEVKSMIKSFELKVNGKTFTKELDLGDEDAIKRELQKAYAGQQSMQKVRELEKSYDQALGELKANPAKFFREMGMDFDEVSYDHLKGVNDELKKSPEEQERDKFQQELEEARAEAKKLREEKDSADFERTLAKEQQLLDDEIHDALSAHKDLPASQKTFQRIAETMLWALENGFDDVKVEDVIPTVKGEIEKEMQETFNEMPLEFYEKFIGKQNMEKLRQERISKAKSGSEAAKVKETTIKKEKTKKKPKMSARDYFKDL